MGLIKRQLLKVIQWEDSSQNTIVKKFEYDDRYAIMKGSELIVRPGDKGLHGLHIHFLDAGQFSQFQNPVAL